MAIQQIFYLLTKDIRIKCMGIVLITFLSILYANGIKQNTHIEFPILKEDFTLMYQQCKHKDYKACYLLGIAYYEGYGVLPNIVHAQYFLMTACKKGVAESCSALADIIQFQYQDTTRAIPLYEQSCNLGYVLSCHSLVTILSSQQNRTHDQNQEIYAILKKTCELNADTTCHNAQTFKIHFIDSATQQDDTITHYRESCHLAEKHNMQNDRAVCGIIGEKYANGDGVKKDKEQARYYFNMACYNNNKFCYKKVLDSILNP